MSDQNGRGQYQFEPIRLFCLIAFNPFKASPRINKGDHCFLSWRKKTMHIKSTNMI